MKEELEKIQKLIREDLVNSDNYLKNGESAHFVIGYLQGLLKGIDNKLETLK